MTYMMQYLTSILFRNNSRNQTSSLKRKIKSLESEVEILKKENQETKKNFEDITVCINEIVMSVAAIANHMSFPGAEIKDPVDEALDSLSNKDDDKGYLH